MELIIILLLIFANGIFAMSEIAIISARKARLDHLAKKGNLNAKTALDMTNNPGTLLSTVQTGITAISVIAGAVSGATLGKDLASFLKQIPFLTPYSEILGYVLVISFITFLSLLIGELVPKRIGLNNPEKIAIRMAPLMIFFFKLAKPIVFLLNTSTEFILRLFRVTHPSEPSITEEEIKMLIRQGNKAGVIEKAEQDILESVFRLSDKKVEAVMTPRTRINWLDIKSSSEENLKLIVDSHHSIFPVCDETLDNLLGIISLKDIFLYRLREKEFNIKEHIKEPLYIPEGTRALKLLDKFKESKKYFSIIIDEYGGVQGLVTITDLVEEVLGELSTQSQTHVFAVKREDGSWLVDGMVSVDDFKKLFNLEILPGEETDDFQTLGGFIMTTMEKVPREGEKLFSSGLEFEIMDMDGNRIDKILVRSSKTEAGIE